MSEEPRGTNRAVSAFGNTATILRAQAQSGTPGRTNHMAVWDNVPRRTLRACVGGGVLPRPETFELVQFVRCSGCGRSGHRQYATYISRAYSCFSRRQHHTWPDRDSLMLVPLCFAQSNVGTKHALLLFSPVLFSFYILQLVCPLTYRLRFDEGIRALELDLDLRNGGRYVIGRIPLVRADALHDICLLYTSPSPRDGLLSRMPSSA